MIDRLIYIVKKQEEDNYNYLGFKITKIGCDVSKERQEYFLVIEDENTKYRFILKNVNDLFKLLSEYGFLELVI